MLACQRHHPRTDVDGQPAHVALACLQLTRVQAGANADPESPHPPADRRRAADAPSRAVEGGEEAVAGVLDLLAAMARELTSDQVVVALKQLVPSTIAHLRRSLDGAADVGEEHGGQHAIGLALGAAAGEELLELPDEGVEAALGVPGPGHRRIIERRA